MCFVYLILLRSVLNAVLRASPFSLVHLGNMVITLTKELVIMEGASL